MGSSARKAKGWLAVSAVVAFLASRYFLLFVHHFHSSPNIKLFRGWVLKEAAGQIPFVDFPIEYPPLAWWLIQIPAAADRARYYFQFHLVMAVADLFAFLLLWWIVSKRHPARTGLIAIVYVAITMILEYSLYDSLDLIVLVALLGAFAAWLKSEASPHRPYWRAVAYLIVGLGASYKVIPIIVLPSLVVWDLRWERRWLPVMLRVGLCVAAILFPFAFSYAESGFAAFGFLRYHSARGIEIGSTWSTLTWLVSEVTGEPIRVRDGFGSWEIVGSFTVLLARMSSLMLVIVSVGFALWGIRLNRDFDGQRSYLQALLLTMALLITSKVLSVQYLLWALPAIMLAAIELASTRLSLGVVLAACVAIAGLTTVFFPLGMESVEPIHKWIMVVLAARNALCVVVTAWLLKQATDRDRAGQTRLAGYPVAARSVSSLYKRSI